MMTGMKHLNKVLIGVTLVSPILAFALGPARPFPPCCTTCGNANHYEVCMDSCNETNCNTTIEIAACEGACRDNCMPQVSPCL